MSQDRAPKPPGWRKPPPKKKLVDVSIGEREGRYVLHWNIDTEGLKEAAKEKVGALSGGMAGALLDKLEGLFIKKKEGDE